MKLSAVLFLWCSILEADKTTIDFPQIAGKTKEEVAKVLGQPSRNELHLVEKDCMCERLYYLQREMYIIYFDGKADLIWASTAKVKIVNFEKAKIKAYHSNKNWVKFLVINLDTRKCCGNKHSS